MPAGPDENITTMRRAVAHSVNALEAAAELDPDRTDEDRRFFADQRGLIEPLGNRLRDAARGQEDYDLGPAARLQARVKVGDQVLDRGLRDGNAKTKTALRGKPGLGADHVFGRRVDDLVDAELRLEPAAVLAAVGRFADLPGFESRDTIRADLQARATTQQRLLGERDSGDVEAAPIESGVVRTVADAADALARLKGALDGRFPRQRRYVASFFMDTRAPRRRLAAPAPPAPPAA